MSKAVLGESWLSRDNFVWFGFEHNICRPRLVTCPLGIRDCCQSEHRQAFMAEAISGNFSNSNWRQRARTFEGLPF